MGSNVAAVLTPGCGVSADSTPWELKMVDGIETDVDEGNSDGSKSLFPQFAA